MKDTTYYNSESSRYSTKRYPSVSRDYVHHLFKRRLALLLRLLESITRRKNAQQLLEVGCADGVVLCAISEKFEAFRSLLGVDISPGMIDVAHSNSPSERLTFSLRDDAQLRDRSFNVVVEIGVLNLTDLSVDLDLASRVLEDGGYYICSIASRTSLISKLKPEGSSDYRHHLTYREYETAFHKNFEIKESIPYGFFIPHLWKVPVLARVLQPLVEKILLRIVPDLFHEKIYLLQKK